MPPFQGFASPIWKVGIATIHGTLDLLQIRFLIRLKPEFYS